MTIKAIIHQEEDCLWAEVPSMPGCITYAEDMDSLYTNLKDAVEGWISIANEQYTLKQNETLLEFAI